MNEQELIKRAIESAKCRIYRVKANNGQSIEHQVRVERQTEIQKVTIKALEKQIVKKVVQSGVTDKNGVFHPTNGIDCVPYDLCPRCGTNLCTTGFLARDKRDLEYCNRCGQKLDWTVEE